MNRRSALRSARAFAIVLPLGMGAAGPEGAALPEPIPVQILDDGEAIAALGAVLRQQPAPHACASVLVRDRTGAPAVVALEWRDLDDHAESGELLLERRSAAASPAGFRLWEGCAPVPRRMREGRLFLTLVETGPAGAPPSRRIASVEIRPEIWSWRPVRTGSPPADPELETGEDGPRRAGPADERFEPAAPAGAVTTPARTRDGAF